MKIIDNQNQKYTRPIDFEVKDFFYDENSEKHYWIINNDKDGTCWRLNLICLETQTSIRRADDIRVLLHDSLKDTSHLIKIDSDQVTMNFYRE